MTRTTIVLSLLAAVAPCAVAVAAPRATQEQADALTATFERYVGAPLAGQPRAVTVLPQGTTYRATFDVQALTRALDSFGFSIDAATAVYTLTPQDDGTWHVVGDDFPSLVMHFGPQTVTLKSDRTTFDGVYDPRIAAFLTATTAQDGSTTSQTAPRLTQERRFESVSTKVKTTPAAGGTASGVVDYEVRGLSSTFASRADPAAPSDDANAAVVPQPAATFSYTSPHAAAHVSLDEAHLRDLLDVWAFLVAHPSRDSLAGAQENLRTLLRTSLPLSNAFSESGSVDELAVTTPIGPFAAKKVTAALGLANLASIGAVTLGLGFDGLAVPTDQLPPWSLGLIPHTVDLHPAVSGLHFAEAARESVDDFDLKAAKGEEFTPEQREKIGHIAWPGDGTLTLAPSHVASDLLDLRMDGEAHLGGGVPTGRLSVTGTGLDKAIATLQAAQASDDMAVQVLNGFVTAKNLAKPNADGSLTWVIEATGPGPLTVNGVPLQ